jgi:hypothetical protein
MFRFGSAPTGITPRDMSRINLGAIEAPLNFLRTSQQQLQLQLAGELSDIGVAPQMAKNLEELCSRSGITNRSYAAVFCTAVREGVGDEEYNRLTAGWAGRAGMSKDKLIAKYFKLTRAVRVAGAAKAVSAAQSSGPRACKACTNPSVPGNYGFCLEHRTPQPSLKKQRVA